jgi:hypothetical protein
VGEVGHFPGFVRSCHGNQDGAVFRDPGLEAVFIGQGEDFDLSTVGHLAEDFLFFWGRVSHAGVFLAGGQTNDQRGNQQVGILHTLVDLADFGGSAKH